MKKLLAILILGLLFSNTSLAQSLKPLQNYIDENANSINDPVVVSYMLKRCGSVYIFELNTRYDIDGSPLFNKARYINHSCNPNCEVDIIRGKIWIMSIKKISEGEELSYDYGYEFDKDDFKDHVCNCGSKNCIGYIISKDDWPKYKRWKKRIKVK